MEGLSPKINNYMSHKIGSSQTSKFMAYMIFACFASLLFAMFVTSIHRERELYKHTSKETHYYHYHYPDGTKVVKQLDTIIWQK